MQEIDSDDPENMYKHAKNALKKYLEKSEITGKGLQTSRDFTSIIPKQETLFFSVDEYESYIAWKTDNSNQKFSSDSKKGLFYGKKNPNISDGKPVKCHTCQSVGNFHCFIDSVSDYLYSKVIKSNSTNKFKFGGGRVVPYLFKVRAPILIANEIVMLSFDVADSDIPLLLSKETMKQWNFTGNFYR